jgi:hypothetical protein
MDGAVVVITGAGSGIAVVGVVGVVGVAVDRLQPLGM